MQENIHVIGPVLSGWEGFNTFFDTSYPITLSSILFTHKYDHSSSSLNNIFMVFDSVTWIFFAISLFITSVLSTVIMRSTRKTQVSFVVCVGGCGFGDHT